jgi:hypothetical protein
MYDVGEIASILNVSKVTVYSKLKLKEVRPFIVKKEGKTYVLEEGFNLIKQNLKSNISLNLEEEATAEQEAATTTTEELNNLKDNLIETLKQQVEHLKEQLSIKDNQLASKDKLLENMQVLLKQDKDQNDIILSLPEKIKEHDIELVNTLAESLARRKEEFEETELKQPKKSFWDLLKGKRY